MVRESDTSMISLDTDITDNEPMSMSVADANGAAAMLKLPAELVQQIASYLDAGSTKQLRCVCRRLHDATFDIFVEQNFHSRSFFVISEDDMQKLHAISTHHLFAIALRKVTLYLDYIGFEDDLKHSFARHEMHAISDNDSGEMAKTRANKRLSKKHIEAHRHALKYKMPLHMLTSIFANLRITGSWPAIELSTICATTSTGVLFTPSVDHCKVIQQLDVPCAWPGLEADVLSNRWCTVDMRDQMQLWVMEALAVSGLQLDRLSLLDGFPNTRSSSSASDHDQRHRLIHLIPRSVFSHLTSLTLLSNIFNFDFNGYIRLDPFSAFFDVLKLATNLRFLTLIFDVDERYVPDRLQQMALTEGLFLQDGFRKLEWLVFAIYNVDHDNLKTFVTAREGTLKHVQFRTGSVTVPGSLAREAQQLGLPMLETAPGVGAFLQDTVDTWSDVSVTLLNPEGVVLEPAGD